MPELEPITREEKLLDGEDLTPITRKEQFIKRIYDNTQVIPEPITREEHFLKKAGEGGGGDVTIEQLNVSENGTYSEAGKAYSPVIVDVPDPVLKTKSITDNGTYNASADNADGYSQVSVNVPLPQNAYLLKSVPNLPQAIAPFNDSEDMVMQSLKVAIEPQQEGSGDPSPTNVRPISGWTEANIVVSPTTDAEDGTTYTILFTVNGETKTIYSGYVEVKNGKVKVIATNGLQPLTNWNWVRESTGGGNYRFRSKNKALNIYERASSNCTSSVFIINRSPIGGAKVDNTLWVYTDGLVYVYCDTYTDATEFKEFVKDTQLLLPLITPIEYDLSDVSINTLLGTNNIWADTGDITDAEYFSKEV